jgi:hypothetical protein
MENLVEWADVPGYEGVYQVSNFGSVVRLKRVLPSLHAKGVRVRVREIGQVQRGKGQRLSVYLSFGGEQKWFQVHRMMLLAFKGPSTNPEETDVLHNDGNHLNNWLGNLRWGTHTDNMRDKTFHGTQMLGSKNHRAKLTEEDVKAIRLDKRTERAIGKAYGVSQVTIHFIRTRKTWRHVE